MGYKSGSRVWTNRARLPNPKHAENMKEDATLNAPTPRKRKLSYDLTGQKIGRLTVLKFLGMRGSHTIWRCQCDCGASATSVQGQNLRNGNTTSCGCFARETAKGTPTHGATNTPEYWAWLSLRSRCQNSSDKSYKHYGGRGISVCARWNAGDGIKTAFECFIEDVGFRPTSKHSLDRWPNKNGNYEPSNVRWATWTEQQNNKTNNHIVTWKGKPRTLAEVASEIGMRYGILHGRIYRGWSLKDAVKIGGRG